MFPLVVRPLKEILLPALAVVLHPINSTDENESVK